MTQPTRRVRAGRPPDNTGCLPVDYTAEQIDAWNDHDAAHAAAMASLDRSVVLLVAGYIAAIMLCIAALAAWGHA